MTDAAPHQPRIGDYGLLADGRTCALVSREGSLDWLCWPRLDAPACFAALLGTAENGRWLLAPDGPCRSSRRYEPGTLVLVTEHAARRGRVRVTDAMAMGDRRAVLRRVEGLEGRVRMRFELVLRPGYGRTVPWVERVGPQEWHAVAGPDLFVLRAPVPLHGEDLHTVGTFELREGERLEFSLAHGPSHGPAPPPVGVAAALDEARAYWLAVSDRIRTPTNLPPEWREAMRRSALTLKALSYAPTGGIAAAATTSLPEALGGARNWDYRHCWLRDAAFTLSAFLETGLAREARGWRDWLVRAVAGAPEQMQIMYGLAGERILPEWTVDWLPGHRGSVPVRVGNAAATQFQLDVLGEVADAIEHAAAHGIPPHPRQRAQRDAVMGHLERVWREPDEGIWEVRGPRRHFVHSKVMAWVAFDRAARGAERRGDASGRARYRSLADEVRREVCRRGWDEALGSFASHYGSGTVDASLLMLPLVGFLPPGSARVRGTVEAVERHLMRDGLLLRYETEHGHDGLEGEEGAFLLCSFWLVEIYAVQGRLAEAEALFARLLARANDLGLLSEEVDWTTGEMLGNFPQAFSHTGIINAASAIARARRPN